MTHYAPDITEASRHFNHACYHGLFDEALELLTQGADPLWTGNSGKCGLHFAAMAGHEQLCSFLVQQYPQTLLFKDHAGMTPLHLACRNVRPLAACALARSGASFDIRDDFGRKPSECCPDESLRTKLAQLQVDINVEQWAHAALTCSMAVPSVRNFI